MKSLLPYSTSHSKELETVKLIFMQFILTLQPAITQRKLPFTEEGKFI